MDASQDDKYSLCQIGVLLMRNVNKTYSLQPSGCIVSLVHTKKIVAIFVFSCLYKKNTYDIYNNSSLFILAYKYFHTHI